MTTTLAGKGKVLAILAFLVVANLLLPWHAPLVEHEVAARDREGRTVVVHAHGRAEAVRGREMIFPVTLALLLAAAAAVQSVACLTGRAWLERLMRKWVALLAALQLAPLVAILLENSAPLAGVAIAFALSTGLLLAGPSEFQGRS